MDQLVLYGNVEHLNKLINSHSAQKVARKANDVLNTANIVETLDDAIEFFSQPYLVGTLSPQRAGGDFNLGRLSLFMEEIPEHIYQLENLVLLFGTESSGLSEEESDRCDLLVSIPTSTDYQAMNLSHAVAIIAHHFYRNMFSSTHLRHRPAYDREKNRLLSILYEVAEVYYPERPHVIQQVFKNIIDRSALTGREAYTLMGLFKKTKRTLEEHSSKSAKN